MQIKFDGAIIKAIKGRKRQNCNTMEHGVKTATP